jgi:hypothetical protein
LKKNYNAILRIIFEKLGIFWDFFFRASFGYFWVHFSILQKWVADRQNVPHPAAGNLLLSEPEN